MPLTSPWEEWRRLFEVSLVPHVERNTPSGNFFASNNINCFLIVILTLLLVFSLITYVGGARFCLLVLVCVCVCVC